MNVKVQQFLPTELANAEPFVPSVKSNLNKVQEFAPFVPSNTNDDMVSFSGNTSSNNVSNSQAAPMASA